MTWLKESESSWWYRFCCNVLKAGRVPRHIAFIMDGNRRFARKMGFNEVVEGHVAGFEKLTSALEWCRDLEIREVTVYAFSIENFKRSRKEVDELFQLAEDKLKLLLDERESIMKHDIRIRFWGNWGMLPTSLRHLMAKLMLFSRNNSRHSLNVCLGYTSTDEVTRSVAAVSDAVALGTLEESDISPELLKACLDTAGSLTPDLLVRTSGEQRFSDFLLWQTTDSCVYFSKVMWPEFTFWNLCAAILQYQLHDRTEKPPSRPCVNVNENSRVAKFLETRESEKWRRLQSLVD